MPVLSAPADELGTCSNVHLRVVGRAYADRPQNDDLRDTTPTAVQSDKLLFTVTRYECVLFFLLKKKRKVGKMKRNNIVSITLDVKKCPKRH